MPTIAQQDYIKIVPKSPRSLQGDAAAMAQLAGCLMRGNIFETMVTLDYDGDDECLARVLANEAGAIYLFSALRGKTEEILVNYTQSQYEGLSAIQLAEDVLSGETIQTIPEIAVDTYLIDNERGILICVDDYKLIATDSGGNLAALSISQDKANPESDDFVNITWEDAQKLIGLPLA